MKGQYDAVHIPRASGPRRAGREAPAYRSHLRSQRRRSAVARNARSVRAGTPDRGAEASPRRVWSERPSERPRRVRFVPSSAARMTRGIGARVVRTGLEDQRVTTVGRGLLEGCLDSGEVSRIAEETLAALP